MRQAIDWRHLSESYRGKWVALAKDLTTVVATGDTAKEAYEAAAKKVRRHFLYQMPATLDLFAGCVPNRYCHGDTADWRNYGSGVYSTAYGNHHI